MARLFVDTSVFLRLYEESDDPKIFDNLKGIADRLVTTKQVINEFARNRQRLLTRAKAAFSESAAEMSKGESGLIRHISHWAEFDRARQEFSKAKAAVAEELSEMVAGKQPDPLAAAFDALWKLNGVKVLDTTHALVARAKERKILGAPPMSSDKHTIGDELNWECLLQLREDLILVSRDSGHLDYVPVLEREYAERTEHRLIMVEKKLSAAITKLGQTPSDSLVDVEKKPEPVSIAIIGQSGMIDFLLANPPYNIRATGMTMPSLGFCLRCQTYSRSGIRCMNCGFVDDND